MTRFGRMGAALTATAALGAGMLFGAVPASADYGNTAIYQIALSMNIPGTQGGGVWIWLELSSDHSVDYSGADCGHGGQGAAADHGSTTWSSSNGTLTIPGVILNGLGGFPATITTPAKTGHYTGTDETFITLPGFIPAGIGFSQLQVAP